MRYIAAILSSICLGLVIPASGATSPPLAARIPADAIVYLGWAGSEAIAQDYEASHLKPVLDASDLPALFDKFIPQLIDRVAKQDRSAAEIMKQVVAIGAPMWKHPTAVYFGGIDWNAPQPSPRLALLCDAGRDGLALVDLISKLLANDQQAPVPIVKQYDSLVVVAFGTAASVDEAFSHLPVDSIEKAPRFAAALSQVQPGAAITEFLDVDGLVKLVDQSIEHVNDAHTTDRWTHARQALGLADVHEAIVTSGFDARDWSEQVFVATNGGSEGISSLLSGAPLSHDLLDAVPQSADRMVAGRFDVDSAVGHVRDIIAEIDQGTADQFDGILAQANQIAELDIRKDFLATLGDEWVYYSDRAVGGPGFLGSVVVNRLKDAEGADKALTQLSHRANGLIAQLMQQPQISIEFQDSVVNGVTLHYLAVPLVTPCWAVKDGNLYLGLYPQVVSAAVDQVTRKGPSILQRSEFAAVLKRLGDHPASSVQFFNLPATAPDGYSDLLAISRLYLGIADIFGVHPPAMVIPPLSKITPELSPAGGVSWSDGSGFHARSVSPFVGSDAIAGANIGSGFIVGEEAMMVSIMLPSMNKARETANRVKCASNMHQIGLGILLYQNDNQQKYPDDLGTLAKNEELAAGVFLCPTGSGSVPANYATMTPDEKAAWVNDHTDYVYVGKGIKGNVDATHVIMYEKDGAHEGEGMNILYGDGHVEFQTTANAKQQIQQQQQGGM